MDEPVVEEVEPDLEGLRAVGDRRGRQAPRVQVERNVPPVIERGRQRQADLARDLRPHVERGAGVLPLGQGQLRPELADGRSSLARHRSIL